MILQTKVSWFKNATNIEVASESTIEKLLYDIKNGTYKKFIDQIRQGNSELKKRIPWVAAHGLFDGFRKKDLFAESSGLIILDIDDIEDDIEEIKQSIMEESDHVFACMTSPSGNGIKILYYVYSDIINQDTYRQIGKQIVNDFNFYGHVDFLSVTDCLVMTYDPNILINEDVQPAYIYLDEVVQKDYKLEPRDESQELWEDAQDFFETVLLNDIESKTNNNFHFIQVSVFDLAKFGFRHPKEDLSFIVDYAEATFKSSSENARRFSEATTLAHTYPQLYWPYKKTSTYEKPELTDYSEFMTEEIDDDSDDAQENDTGEINYDNIFDRVLQVAEEGDRVGAEISLKNFAEIFRFKGSGILTVTGIPTSGKTEFIDQCIMDLKRLHNQDSIIIGFEQTPEEHLIKLCRKLIGTDIRHKTWLTEENKPIFRKAIDVIVKGIRHIDAFDTSDINELLKRAAKLINKMRKEGDNPRYIVIDPFNMLSIKGRFSDREKVDEILRVVNHFSHQVGVMAIFVAHPFKMKKDEKTGQYEIPDFYSVKGSSAWYEMSYHGLVVHRLPSGIVLVRVLKVKQNNLGTKDGEALFDYHKPSGRYIPLDSSENEMSGDHNSKNWLEEMLNINKQIHE